MEKEDKEEEEKKNQHRWSVVAVGDLKMNKMPHWGGVRYWIYSIAECYVAGRALLQTKGGER